MKKSKLAKVLTVSLAALMVFGLASCGGGSGKVSFPPCLHPRMPQQRREPYQLVIWETRRRIP